jgi:hypothetical protein
MTESLDQLASLYVSLKTQAKHIEEQMEKIKKRLEQSLEEHNKSKIISSHYIIERRPMVMERMTKQDVPESVWRQYAKSHSHYALYVRENKTAAVSTRRSRTARSRSRSGA